MTGYAQDPILTALDRCGITYDSQYDLLHVSCGVAVRVNWELRIRTNVTVSQSLLDSVTDRLPHGVGLEVL